MLALAEIGVIGRSCAGSWLYEEPLERLPYQKSRMFYTDPVPRETGNRTSGAIQTLITG